MQIAEIFVAALEAYVLAGVLFAAVFVLVGIHRVDPVAKHAPTGFRLIITPGVAALWPLLLTRWLRS